MKTILTFLRREKNLKTNQIEENVSNMNEKIQDKFHTKELASETLDDDDDEIDNESDEIDDLAPLQENFKPGTRLKCARHSVSAEVYGEWNSKQNFKTPVYKKTPEQELRVKNTIANSFMFQNLDHNELTTVVAAFNEISFQDGDVIIKQGNDGNCLYIIESGLVEIYKFSIKDTQDVYLGNLSEGEIFGELALLYNTPRAATIKAKGDVILWKLDRECFNHIVRNSAIERRELYDSFLKEVEILKDMDSYERSKLSDALKPCTFVPNETIITQGDLGDVFYIIESGTAVAIKDGVECMQYKRGDYFGELALIKNQPRAATVEVKNQSVKCLSLDRKSFRRLLGPVESILKRNAARYEQFQISLNQNN